MNPVTAMQVQDPVLGEIVRRLVDDCQPERIYLFGSRARGNARADSDYDIMVVAAQSDEPAYRRAQPGDSQLATPCLAVGGSGEPQAPARLGLGVMLGLNHAPAHHRAV